MKNPKTVWLQLLFSYLTIISFSYFGDIYQIFFSFRFRIDNVPEVTIKDIFLRPDDMVDFWFSGIHQNLTLSGAIKCPACLTQELQLTNLTAYKKPQINIHIIKSGSVLLDNFVKETEVSKYF